MRVVQMSKFISLLILLASLPSACLTSKNMTVASTAALLEDVARASYKQSDLQLVREGMPSYLMLIDGMVEGIPDNKELLITAAQSYASYASAFIQDQDKFYAAALFAKARMYALRALELNGISKPASRSFEEFESSLNNTTVKDVPYLFWAASCWGSWISLNRGSMAAMAELPRVELMMKRVLVLDSAFYHGGAHIFMGILVASKPRIVGGDLNVAREHFQKAVELGGGKYLMAKIYFAEYYARKAFDRELYLETLEEVLATPADTEPELTLINSVAHARTRKMIAEADEHF